MAARRTMHPARRSRRFSANTSCRPGGSSRTSTARSAPRAARRGQRLPATPAPGALRATRGAGVEMIAVDLDRGVARYAGVGNIAAVILNANGTRQSLVSQNGTAGHTIPRIQEYNYPVAARATLVMYSDGLGTHWDLAAYPGLLSRHPSIIAAVLYRDFSRKRDDVTVVVLKERPARD